MPCYARARKKRFTLTFEPRACFLYACSENYWMMNIYRYATRAILTLFFFTITIISTVSTILVVYATLNEELPSFRYSFGLKLRLMVRLIVLWQALGSSNASQLNPWCWMALNIGFGGKKTEARGWPDSDHKPTE